MPYLLSRNGQPYEALGFDAEQQKALTPSAEELASLPPEVRANLLMQQQELKVRRSEAFWTAVQGFALGALPIFGFLGIRKLFK